jgi:hypothetical protein
MTEKTDLRATQKSLYQPSAAAPVIVDVPEMAFLMIDGEGNPNTSPEYQQAVSALFQLSYALKFAVKKGQGLDYAVMPLEGLWWLREGLEFTLENKDSWCWTMMIRQPDPVTSELVEETREQVRRKKNPPRLSEVRCAPYAEGLSVQLMHIGPYADEHPNIMRMHAFAREQGYRLDGKHHEIYISDVTKTAPERLKTVLRQPVRLPAG